MSQVSRHSVSVFRFLSFGIRPVVTHSGCRLEVQEAREDSVAVSPHGASVPYFYTPYPLQLVPPTPGSDFAREDWECLCIVFLLSLFRLIDSYCKVIRYAKIEEAAR